MSQPPDHFRPEEGARGRWLYFSLGFLALFVQVILVRQLLAAFSGNELDIGIVLGVWLLAFGLGSIAGRRISGGRLTLAVCLGLAGLLLQPLVALTRGLRPFLLLETGEVFSLATTIVVTLACIVPIALVLGVLFPLAVRSTAEKRYAAGRVYAWEAGGAMLAGLLFTLVLSTRVDGVTLSAATSAGYLVLAALVLKRPAAFSLILIPAAAYLFTAQPVRALPWKGFDLVTTRESRFGETAVVSSAGQRTVFESGKPLFSFPDAQTEEFTAHTAMTLHDAPKRVLLIGGSPGLLPELLKYPEVSITFLESNPVLLELWQETLSEHAGRTMVSPRITVLRQDGREYLKKNAGVSWDLIFLEIPVPTTAETNRYFTVEFFREARQRIRPDGLLVLRAVPSFGYTGSAARRLNSTLFHSLKTAFSQVTPASRESGLLVASSLPLETRPSVLKQRFLARNLATTTFSPGIFEDLFSPLEMAMRTRELEEPSALNTDERPVAYTLALVQWAELQESPILRFLLAIPPGWLVAVLGSCAVLVPLLARGRPRPAIHGAILTTGATGMALSVGIMLAFQATHGYVFEAVALITAAFMAGAAAGAFLAGRETFWTRSSPLETLAAMETVFVLLLFGVPFVFAGSLSFYLASLCGGLITGLEFGTATRALGARGSSPEAAGRLYGLDLIGSCLGAMTTAIFLVPRLGIKGTFFGLALLKTGAAVGLVTAAFGRSRSKENAYTALERRG